MPVPNDFDDDLTLVTDEPGFGLDAHVPAEEPPAEEPPAEEPPAEEPPAEEPPAEEPPAEEPPAEEPPAEEPPAEEPPTEPKPPEADKKPITIPKAVFDSRLKKARQREDALRQQRDEAMQRLREFEQQTPNVEIKPEEYKQLGDLLLDGKTEEYAAGMQQIMNRVYTSALTAAQQQAADRSVVMTSEINMQKEREAAALEVSSKYDFFDPGSENFNREMTAEALMYRDAYEANGYSPADAIYEAASMVMLKHGLLDVGQPQPEVPAQQPAAQQPAKPAPAPQQPAAPAQPSPAMKKAVEAATRQPPSSVKGAPPEPDQLLTKAIHADVDDYDKIPQDDIDKMLGIK